MQENYKFIGSTVDEVWEAYGGFLIHYTMQTGWDDLLRAMASTLEVNYLVIKKIKLEKWWPNTTRNSSRMAKAEVSLRSASFQLSLSTELFITAFLRCQRLQSYCLIINFFLLYFLSYQLFVWTCWFLFHLCRIFSTKPVHTVHTSCYYTS